MREKKIYSNSRWEKPPKKIEKRNWPKKIFITESSKQSANKLKMNSNKQSNNQQSTKKLTINHSKHSTNQQSTNKLTMNSNNSNQLIEANKIIPLFELGD